MSPRDSLARKRLTLEAMGWLIVARLLVARVPMREWRNRLGMRQQSTGSSDETSAPLFAAHVERAAQRLPVATRCLARAMALSWMLRRRGIAHELVIALRPMDLRARADALHAWVEVGERIILGELPGSWSPVLRLPPNCGGKE